MYPPCPGMGQAPPTPLFPGVTGHYNPGLGAPQYGAGYGYQEQQPPGWAQPPPPLPSVDSGVKPPLPPAAVSGYKPPPPMPYTQDPPPPPPPDRSSEPPPPTTCKPPLPPESGKGLNLNQAPPPPPPGEDAETVKDLANQSKVKSVVSKLSAPPPPPPPDEDKVAKKDPNKIPGLMDEEFKNPMTSDNWSVKKQSPNGNQWSNQPFVYEGDSEYDDGFAAQERYEEKIVIKEPEPEPEEDWTCTQGCGVVNFAWRSECSKCGCPKQTLDADTTTNIRQGDWRCPQCQEINFAKRDKCRKCQLKKGEVPPKKETPQDRDQAVVSKDLQNLHNIFSKWEADFETWKVNNRNNPDRNYVDMYMSQMEAMRIQFLEQKAALESVDSREFNQRDGEGGSSRIRRDEANMLAKRMLRNQDYDSDEDQNNFVNDKTTSTKMFETDTNKRSQFHLQDREGSFQRKKSRWEQNDSNLSDRRDNNAGGDLDIKSWRRSPLQVGHNYNQSQEMDGNDFNEYWKPSSVKDYSNANCNERPSSHSKDGCEFKPQTFDYSHGSKNDSYDNNPFDNRRQPNPFDNRSSSNPFENRSFSDNPFDNRTPRNWNNRPNSNFDKNEVGRFSPLSRGWGGKFDSQGSNNSKGFNSRGSSSERSLPSLVREEKAPPLKMGNRVMVDSIISPPGRNSRPPRLVVIMRGIPGSGKTHLARLLKEKEVENGGEPPRTLSLDDYFDCDGEYTYEADMEETYRASFIKSFKKNIDGGYFPFLIVDAVHQKIENFREIWSHSKQNGFEVYICDVECELGVGAARNCHGRTVPELKALKKDWEDTPSHMNTLDVTSLLQDDAIEHVVMDEVSSQDGSDLCQPTKEDVPDDVNEDEEGDDQTFLKASKWEILDKEESMARLDGTTEKAKAKLAAHHTIEDWLELEKEDISPAQDGKKRVRWADLEQRKAQAKARQFGFVVGQTNWASQQDKDREASQALTSTKIIPNRFHSEFHN